jgi:hypothetical protein
MKERLEMNTYNFLALNPILPICGIAIFIVLFLAIHASLKKSRFFQERSVTAVAICVPVLCLMGMYQTFFPSGTGQGLSEGSGHPGAHPLLVPYTALGISILLMLLLMLLAKLVRGSKAKKQPKTAFPTEFSYPSKPKEEWPVSQTWPIKQHRKTAHSAHPMNGFPIKTLRNRDLIEERRPDIKPINDKGIRYEDR